MLIHNDYFMRKCMRKVSFIYTSLFILVLYINMYYMGIKNVTWVLKVTTKLFKIDALFMVFHLIFSSYITHYNANSGILFEPYSAQTVSRKKLTHS